MGQTKLLNSFYILSVIYRKAGTAQSYDQYRLSKLLALQQHAQPKTAA